MRPKIGVIGCGSIAKFHFDALEKAGVCVVHVSDINETAGKPYAVRFGARFSQDYEKLIADPEVSAVFVLTNSKYHKEICLSALQAKKDIVCEKTMMNDAQESFLIANEVKKENVLFLLHI